MTLHDVLPRRMWEHDAIVFQEQYDGVGVAPTRIIVLVCATPWAWLLEGVLGVTYKLCLGLWREGQGVACKGTSCVDYGGPPPISPLRSNDVALENSLHKLHVRA